jgi:Co/Zn/Cd efflux system component/copper chaperone CopZ
VTTETVKRYQVSGMDCADCAAHIEAVVRAQDDVDDVRVSLGTQTMTLRLSRPRDDLSAIDGAVAEIGYGLRPVSDDSAPAPAPANMAPGYRRALWIVVLLNAGYGVVELFGGFLSGSQALKADALDFLGDGTITFLGIVALGWGLVWRARSALIQGVFLGALGVGVLVNTLMRLQAGYQPEAALMGAFAVVAVTVNVVAALVLLPHRTGDANVRAVWLFSRNDALGNVAVVVAAGLVAVLDSAVPDVAVAFVIAGLFLQSSVSIVRDARRDAANAG